MNQSEQIFQKLVEDNQARIYRICRIYAVSPLEPRDLFQEILYQIWKSLPTFEGRSSINTWVYRIALNVCYRLNTNQNKANRKRVQLDNIVIESSETGWTHQDQHRYQALQACISQLKEIDRSVIILYLEELAYKEISTITGLSENNIAVKVKRIKDKLFECLSAKDIH